MSGLTIFLGLPKASVRRRIQQAVLHDTSDGILSQAIESALGRRDENFSIVFLFPRWVSYLQ
jgi:hypothetical protein